MSPLENQSKVYAFEMTSTITEAFIRRRPRKIRA